MLGMKERWMRAAQGAGADTGVGAGLDVFSVAYVGCRS